MPLRRQGGIRIQRDELDGVPVYWAEGSPPFVVGVIFRVGRSDEDLANGGVSHLVEHLAIPPRRFPNVDVNGTVTGSETMFWAAAGSQDDALAAFGGILEGLAEPPLQRLEAERQILLTEAASSGGDPVSGAAALRFGARGHGLVAYGEFGLYRLEAEDVERWWRTYFTGGNAALWMTGKPPRGFRVPLLEGDRRPAHEPQPISDVRFPAHEPDGPSGGVYASLLVERSFAANAVVDIAEDRLRQRLRFERGASYGVQAVYDRLSAGHAHCVFWADCLDQRAATVRDDLLSTLRSLGEEGPTEEELREGAESLRRAVRDPASAGTYTYGFASDELVGAGRRTSEELVEGRAAVRPEDAARVLSEALETMLLTTPESAGGLAEGFERYPLTSSKRVSGRAHRPSGVNLRGDLRKARLVVADDGISIISPTGDVVTVLFAECCAVLRWLDGHRVLWDEDGFSLEVMPDFWRGGSEVVRKIDATLSDDLFIPMERELEERTAGVDSAAGELKGRFMSKDEVAALPHELREGETVVNVARGSQGLKAGLVAVTDQRVLFLYFDEVKVDLPLAEIRAVEARAKGFWVDNELVLTKDDGRERFTDIGPKERLDELSAAIRERIRADREPGR
jgi:predicted Zn-dependent peptidase